MLMQPDGGLGPARARHRTGVNEEREDQYSESVTESRKRVGSCTLEWGQEQEHGGALAQRLSRAL